MLALIQTYPWPSLNAFLNGLSAIFLSAGFVFIWRGDVARHRRCMLSAFVTSIIFLICYLAYHAHAGHVHFKTPGLMRDIYYVILTTHTLLAMVIAPLILRTLYLALHNRFGEHRRWARWTFPLWLYVSVTGVVVYVMLYGLRNAGR